MVNKKGKIRRYIGGRKRAFHRAKKTFALAPIMGLIASPATRFTIKSMMDGDYLQASKELGRFAGIDPGTNSFKSDILVETYIPLVAGIVVHKCASMLGVNRIFAKLPSPLNKVAI